LAVVEEEILNVEKRSRERLIVVLGYSGLGKEHKGLMAAVEAPSYEHDVSDELIGYFMA
jgi:hypothetical protein